MKRKILLIVLLGFFVFQPIEALAVVKDTSVDTTKQTSEEVISPFKDIIKWRYKTKNNKLYKRQYNYSKEKWIGSWQVV
ncbi:hypothetical protein [Tetragenococcus solitarius]|uniref:Uncharacterized protein n=1 Tax=Tetragenococcus solitarius TaxID=71453 RepID=A0ABP6KW09_9ENTE|nr:hypothetical protein [Tetragenococcus solitarius]